MKKRILSIMLLGIIMCSMFSVPALAANETSMTTTVSYIQGVPEGYYEVNIPSTIALNEVETIYFTVRNVNIGENQSVSISIDSSSTFENGQFYLVNEYGGKITASVQREGRNGGSSELITGLVNPVVATFVNGDTMPTSYGNLSIYPNTTSKTQPGTYTGYIHFNIAIVDN